jgi:peptidoglycan/xylan/chitin deacetylase (PgdA/CDA1 family)
MATSRGEFLKALGHSMAGLVASTGVGAAAEALAKQIAPEEPGEERKEDKPVSVEETQPAGEKFIHHGPETGRRVALTFDDGPIPGVTEPILEALKQRGMRATFFMVGREVAAAMELAGRVAAEGHEIGNHSFTHPKLTLLADREVEGEIQKTQEILAEVGVKPRWFRPPYGALWKGQAHMAKERGMGIVMWSADPGDWRQPGEAKIVEGILSQTVPGSIILCHDRYPQTAACIGEVLDGLQARGFELVTLSELLAEPDAI